MTLSEELAGRLRSEAQAMYAAVQGEETPGTFHALNWTDKPHRVLYDAIGLLNQGAAENERLTAERDEAREQFDNHVAWASNESAKLEETNARLSTELAAAREALASVRDHFDGKRRDKEWTETERLVRAALLSGEKGVG